MQKLYSGTKQKYLIWYIVFNVLKYDANKKLGYLYVKFTLQLIGCIFHNESSIHGH